MSLSTRWWHGILARSLLAMAGIALLMGSAGGIAVGRIVGERVQSQAMLKLGELLDTVESTVSVACFTNDEGLAYEVAQGLLRNSEVRRVVIRGSEREIAQVARSGVSAYKDEAVELRQVRSPFKANEIIGTVQVEIDQQVIDARVAEEVNFAYLLLLGVLLLVIAATTGSIFLFIVRPIKQTSDRMHDLDVTSGESLKVPQGHERSEIGRLVEDVNQLTGRLVEVLDQERDLRQRQEIGQRKYHDLFDNSSAGIFVARSDGRIDSFNRAFAEMTWLPLAEDQEGGRRRLTEAQWRNPMELLAMIVASLLDGTTHESDFQLDGRRGDMRWLHVTVVPLGDGSVQGTVTDVTLIKQEELFARRLAVTDSLTSFANREGLNQAYAQLQSRTTPFILVRIDFDGIRQITEALGVPVGDRALLSVASRLRAAMESNDFVARISGTKFALVLEGEYDREVIAHRIDVLAEHLAQPYPSLDDDRSVPVVLGVRVGAARFPDDGVELQHLLRRAELALGNVPVGSHTCIFFNPVQEAAVEHRRRMEDDLRVAVATGELELYCQPIVDLRQGRVVGGEALLRWTHPQHGAVPPETFVPMAEQIGLIGEIGRWVLKEACRYIAHWRNVELDLYVSVNVSVRQIPDELAPGMVAKTLEQYGLPPQALAIEITESLLMNDVTIAQEWIASLRAMGLHIYMDDFGTGYSSLSYLKRFALDTVKIDRSFVRDMSADNSDFALVNAIITMAKSLGLGVVAEGIEDEQQFRLLRQSDCGFGQGNYFSRPVPMSQFNTIAMRINDELASYC
ncbi:PAS domain S-box/diguanylate cyclase (GGDEF) domain-containing protein [Sterolibacterium denitrificans]|uniref:PAS domain S-box/diguanylate cyclase (GGDEF) domain-containing protein n=1 Tax=Sterolibacterium denitrificans TaxID=157592 RepID=A0A7Z7MU94_9PROT|nr:bifunctional diguanylate cyclase/phosphodiesterase [Sterolibacterium denitrificans]SMB21600.1 PAS domain S-box/diguanylate cyclase (GGDEF) domain-containing protein [Sterolibacterium denitrificans]